MKREKTVSKAARQLRSEAAKIKRCLDAKMRGGVVCIISSKKIILLSRPLSYVGRIY